MRICKLCNNEFYPYGKQRYCGDFRIKGTCAWKADRLFKRLRDIKERCLRPGNIGYDRYKNYKICKKWMEDSFSFVLWAINNGWDIRLQIDRRNNDRGYYPSNCMWVTPKENSRNKKDNVTLWNKNKRICCRCNIIKSFDEFNKHTREACGIEYECRDCQRITRRLKYSRRLPREESILNGFTGNEGVYEIIGR